MFRKRYYYFLNQPDSDEETFLLSHIYITVTNLLVVKLTFDL